MKKVVIILVIILSSIFVFFKLATLTREPSDHVVFAPVSEPGKITGLDESFLKIKLLTGTYEVSLLEESIRTTQIDSVESFLIQNKSEINKDKTVVVGNEKMKDFQAISSLLKKHGITRFRLLSE